MKSEIRIGRSVMAAILELYIVRSTPTRVVVSVNCKDFDHHRVTFSWGIVPD